MEKTKKIKIFGLVLIVFMVVIFLFPQGVSAQEADPISDWIKAKLFLGLAWIVYGFVWAIGILFTFLVHQLQLVFEWSHFIDVRTVEIGWGIVRDLCNMFFILILLVIAFATILRRESYSAKRLFPLGIST